MQCRCLRPGAGSRSRPPPVVEGIRRTAFLGGEGLRDIVVSKVVSIQSKLNYVVKLFKADKLMRN